MRVLRRATAEPPPGQPRRQASPGIFDSGYFVLSALDGTPPRARRRREAVDLERGGQAATMLVISRYPFNSPGSIALNRTPRLAKPRRSADDTGLAAGVAGGPGHLNTYSRVTRDRIP